MQSPFAREGEGRLRNLLRVDDRLAVVPRMDLLDPVAVEAGYFVPGRRLKYIRNRQSLGVSVVPGRVDPALRIAGLRAVPQVRSGMTAVPSLFNEESELSRYLNAGI